MYKKYSKSVILSLCSMLMFAVVGVCNADNDEKNATTETIDQNTGVFRIIRQHAYWLEYMGYVTTKNDSEPQSKKFSAAMPVAGGSRIFKVIFPKPRETNEKLIEVIELYSKDNENNETRIPTAIGDCSPVGSKVKRHHRCYAKIVLGDDDEYSNYLNFVSKIYDDSYDRRNLKNNKGKEVAQAFGFVPKIEVSLDKSAPDGFYDKLIIANNSDKDIKIKKIEDGQNGYVKVIKTDGEDLEIPIGASLEFELKVNNIENAPTNILEEIIKFQYATNFKKREKTLKGELSVVLDNTEGRVKVVKEKCDTEKLTIENDCAISIKYAGGNSTTNAWEEIGDLLDKEIFKMTVGTEKLNKDAPHEKWFKQFKDEVWNTAVLGEQVTDEAREMDEHK